MASKTPQPTISKLQNEINTLYSQLREIDTYCKRYKGKTGYPKTFPEQKRYSLIVQKLEPDIIKKMEQVDEQLKILYEKRSQDPSAIKEGYKLAAWRSRQAQHKRQIKPKPFKLSIHEDEKTGKFFDRQSGDFLLLDINEHGTLTNLSKVPGLSKHLAKLIVDFIEKNGGIQDIEMLKKVRGIDNRKLTKIKQYFTTM